MSIYENLRFQQYRTTRDTSLANFSGECIFDITLGANQRLLWEESYLAIRFSISENAAVVAKTDGDVLLGGLSNNPFACLFTTAMYRINDQVVSKINDFPQTYSVMRALFSGDGQHTKSLSDNPCHYADRNNETSRQITDNAGTGTVAAVTPEIWERWNNLMSVGAYGTTECQLTMKLPFFNQKSLESLPPNTRHQISLQVNPLWRNAVMYSQTKTSSPDVDANNVYKMNVSNLILWLAQYESVPVSPSSLFKTEYSDVFSTVKTLISTVEQFQLTIPRNCNRLMLCFFDTRTIDGASPTNSPQLEIQKISRMRCTFDGQYFPSPDYVFSDSFRSIDTKRAYSDYVRQSQSLLDSAGAVLSYGQWLRSPIFCFRVQRPGGSQSNTLEVELNFSTGPAHLGLWVGAMYDRTLSITYNEFTQVSQVEVVDV